jgi:hypothetical protein
MCIIVPSKESGLASFMAQVVSFEPNNWLIVSPFPELIVTYKVRLEQVIGCSLKNRRALFAGKPELLALYGATRRIAPRYWSASDSPAVFGCNRPIPVVLSPPRRRKRGKPMRRSSRRTTGLTPLQVRAKVELLEIAKQDQTCI